MTKSFVLKEETRRRCHVIPAKPANLARLFEVPLESFHFLYEAKAVDFNVYFRAGDELVEFMRADEYTPELLRQLEKAMSRDFDDIAILILKKDMTKWQAILERVRLEKLNQLFEADPLLDRKTLEVYRRVCLASQLVIKGGINREISQQIAQSAEALVNNLIDSNAAVLTLIRLILADPSLYDHAASAAMFSCILATQIPGKTFSKEMLTQLARCALYHDIGQTMVPQHIVCKPDMLTAEEYEIVKQHCQLGHDELRRAREQDQTIIDDIILRVALEHHESFDGQGYPGGKQGRLEDNPKQGIHIFSRIIAIADVYSALLMKRPYKPAYEALEALNIMELQMQTFFDPQLLDVFNKLIRRSLKNYKEELDKIQKAKGKIIIVDEGKIRIR